MYIILNEEHVNLLKLNETPDFELNPIKLNDGVTYVLPIRVLEDEKHSAENRMLLSTFPIRQINDDEWAPNVIEFVEEES